MVNGRIACITLLAAAVLLPAMPVAAADNPLSRAMETGRQGNRNEAATQEKIDRLSAQTRELLGEYHAASRELDALRVYNDQLERLLHSQEEEKRSLSGQMAAMEMTQREILPLMLRMIDSLGAFVEADHPFLPEERRVRVEQLRALMDRADVSTGEKYRRIMEAYQVEMEYGRSIEAYRGELAGESGARTVDFLRLGRLGIYYRTLDGQESGWWNRRQNAWEVLPVSFNATIRQGLRIARNQAAPELLRLPVPAVVTGDAP